MTGSKERGDLVGDMPPDELGRLAHEVADWIAHYLATIDDRPVFPDMRPGDLRRSLPQTAPEQGEPMERVLADFRELVVPGLTHWNHPAFFGYYSITASGPGILGEMLAAALNVNAMVWRSSPAATELEDVTMAWLRTLLGLPEGFEGVINDTASSSSLYALAAARERAYPEAHRWGLFGQPRGRIYASDQAHSSIEKAVLTLGLGQDGYRAVESDRSHCLDVGALRRAISEDVASGIRPIAVVATAGTTSSASIDPIAAIADVAEEFGGWLHVDAAYGGTAAILPELRARFEGWERADSIVVNPHKWLFTPIDCSALYCRFPETLAAAFSIVPEYLRSTEQHEARSLMDYGVSLGRRFRALKLWFVLRYFGREGIVARVRQHIRLAKELEASVRSTESWIVAAPVHLALVTLRYEPDGVNPDLLDPMNHRIMERVNASGEAFLTHTALEGRTVLRISIGNLKTERAHVEKAWARLQEAAAEELAALS